MDLNSFMTAILTGLAAVLVAALANTLLPGVRWARWLKRDLDIYNGLPDDTSAIDLENHGLITSARYLSVIYS